MKRDMNLMRKILFKIEEKYEPSKGSFFGISIEGYDMFTIAEHCDLLYQEGLIKSYKPLRGNDTVVAFKVGNLTHKGYEYLELIRNDDVWEKTEREIEEKKWPKTLEVISRIAGIFVGSAFGEMHG